MYLVPIQVPIYLDGDHTLVSTEWHRSLLLLRDSFAGKFGPIVLVAPSLPIAQATGEQTLVEISPTTDGLQLKPSFDKRCRAREFWLRQRARWQADLASLLPQANVVHAGVDDVYRPIAFEGFRAAVRRQIPTVFVQDTDNVIQQRQLFANQPAIERTKTGAYTFIYERMCRWSVARADLSLLKGASLMRRYGRFAKNAREFHDTSFSASQIIAAAALEKRLATLNTPRSIRLVYCGRLVPRKGVDRSIQILAAARAAGADIQFDILGDGPEKKRLTDLAASLGVASFVRFLGAAPYDDQLLRRLGEYDALLFTPIAEDTPRMIFDGYAAGLSLLAFDIDYVRERAEQEQATVLLPANQIERSAQILTNVFGQPQQLAQLSRQARAAADYHCAENWYRRRAEWTIEAVERHAASSGEKPAPLLVTSGREA
jgi:glycosyltransferase involved in cell wall biosynthesis